MAHHHARVAPARARRRSLELEVDVLRGYGRRAVCSCEWRGPIRSTFAEARADARAHAAEAGTSSGEQARLIPPA